MGHKVPTLLGIAIILLFALLVIGIYQIAMYSRLAQGQTVVGIAGQSLLTGVEPPTETVSAPAATPVRKPAINPAQAQARAGRSERVMKAQQQREARMGQRRGGAMRGERRGG
jgi:hypothetical protein